MKKTIVLAVALSLMAGSLSAQTFKYIGAEKCKMCHNKPATGEQYNKWLADPHAKALKTLSAQASLDYAKKNGIADPSKEPKCLKCHSTFDSVDPKLRNGVLATEGVSCESCHGPGSAYKTPVLMKNVEQAKANGLVVPDNKLCITCHNKENPFHKEFNYETFAAKIAHPNPAAKQ